MARKYIVISQKETKYETNFYIPFLNLLAGIVWSIAFVQKVLPEVEGVAALGVGAVFSLVYVILSVMPVIAIFPCIGSTIMYTAMLWGFADYINDDIFRIAVKILVLIVVLFFEFCIFGNATLLWLQNKFPNKPIVRVVEDDE